MAKTFAKTQDRVIKELQGKIRDKTARIGVIGLGYIGLPLAIEFAKSGYLVTGIDTDVDRIDHIKSGQSHLKNIDDATISSFIDNKQLSAIDDMSAIADLDTISICVPTPLTETHEPDMSFVLAAVQAISKYLRTEQLIVLESTTYPGTTEEVVKPILEQTGLVAGKDFYLGYSPERVDPGNEHFNIKNTPKIVSGSTLTCLEHVTLLYKQIADIVVPVSSMSGAELAKLHENIFRNVNIALVNELTLLCDRLDVDVWEVIDAAATKPFGFMKFYPGPGLGGHCIPVDPFYLSWKARKYNFHTEFIELAGKINENMPYYVVTKIADALNHRQKSLNSAKILLLGAAYKKNISDVRESPIFKIIELLIKKQAGIGYHDPFVPVLPAANKTYRSVPLTDDVLQESDCVVIITDHSNIDYQRVATQANLVIDTRNTLKNTNEDHILRI